MQPRPLSDRPRPSRVLAAYYGFLLFSTAISYGLPYPLFGVLLTGPVALVAVVVDCLLLVHIMVGVVKAQQLSWVLLLAYNVVNLASLGVTLLAIGPGEVSALIGGEVPAGAFYASAGLGAAAMALATLYAWRFRSAFWNRNPYLF